MIEVVKNSANCLRLGEEFAGILGNLEYIFEGCSQHQARYLVHRPLDPPYKQSISPLGARVAPSLNRQS